MDAYETLRQAAYEAAEETLGDPPINPEDVAEESDMSNKRFIDGAWREVYTVQIDHDLAHDLADIFFLCGETEERAGELARALLTHIGDHDLEIVRLSDDDEPVVFGPRNASVCLKGRVHDKGKSKPLIVPEDFEG